MLPQFLAFQTCWFVSVVFAGRGLAWPGVAATALFCIWRWSVAGRHRRTTGVLMALGLLCATVVDGGAQALGWLLYASPTPSLLPHGPPLWIAGLWSAFATTMLPIASFLHRHLRTTVLIAAACGPATYLGAANGFHALTFDASAFAAAVLWVGLGYGGAALLLVRYAAAHAQVSRQHPATGARP